MTVVINEFDVLVEPPAAADTEDRSTENRPQEPQLTPQDIRDVERFLAERRARLRAH
jgi:hypothetical protein